MALGNGGADDGLTGAECPVDVRDTIDELCDAFESSIQAHQPMDLSTLVNQVPTLHQPLLMQELLLVAVEYACAFPKALDGIEELKDAARDADSSAKVEDHSAEAAASVVSNAEAPQQLDRSFGGYELLEEVGRGGMGVVYRAYHHLTARFVALKLLHATGLPANDPRLEIALARFRTEVHAAARLDHPNIVQVHDLCNAGASPFFTMRFVDGTSLAQTVQAGPLSQQRAARYMTQVARAVYAMHQAGVLHRDLKPSNILVDAATDTPLVSDFGLAKLADGQAQFTLSGDFFGSPPYMSPEQVVSPDRVTEAADIYGLGATLYHLLVGRPPFQAATIAQTTAQVVGRDPVAPRKLNPAISRDLETICLKCLEKDGAKRYASAALLADDLQRFLDNKPVVARPVRWPTQVGRWARRNPVPSALSAILAFGLVVGTASLTVMYVIASQAARAEQRLSTELRSSLIHQARADAESAPSPALALPRLVDAIRLDADASRDAWWDRVRYSEQLEKCGEQKYLGFHTKLVNVVKFDGTASHIISGSDDRTANVWDATNGSLVSSFPHDSVVTDACLSSEGKYALTSTFLGTAYLWDVRAHTLQGTLPHDKLVSTVAFSSDDERIATASYDSTARIWRRKDLACEAVLEHPASVLDCRFAGESCVVTRCADRCVYAWSIPEGKMLWRFQHASSLSTFAISPDGKQVLIGAADGAVYLKASETGATAFEATELHRGQVHSVAFANSGKLLLSGGADGLAYLIDAESGRQKDCIICGASVRRVAFCASDQFAVTCCSKQGVTLWDVESGGRMHGPFPNVRAMAAVDPHTATIAMSGVDNSLRLCRFLEIQKKNIKRAPSVADCQLNDDRTRLLMLDSAGAMCLHDLESNGITKIGNQPGAIGVRLSSDAATCIAASSDGHILEWDIAEQRQRRQWRHGEHIDSFAVAQNVCVAAGADHLRLWRLTDLRLILDASLDSGKRPLVCLSNDAERLAVMEGDTLSYWTLKDGAADFVERAKYADRIVAAQFSNRGGYLAVACADGSVSLRNPQGKVREISNHAAIPTLLVFHPDSCRLLIARDGGLVEIGNTQSSQAETLALAHDTNVEWASFSTSGNEVVTADKNGAVSLWDVVSGELILRRNNDSAELCPAFLCDRDSKLAICLNASLVTCDYIQGVGNSLEEIVCWSELISGQRFGAPAGGAALTTSEAEQRWNSRRPIRRMSRPGF